MSVQYTWVQWNRHKKVYDLVLTAAILTYVISFIVVSKFVWAGDTAHSDEVLIIRAFGTCGFTMLSMVLMIGPLARFDDRFAPLLYNRRHFGVATFFVGLMHGVLTIGYYQGFGIYNPVKSLWLSSTALSPISAFPFEWLGVGALLILFVMAATSHDFWLKNLSPGVWKAIHMLVYLAYGLLVGHIALGALQAERSVLYTALILAVPSAIAILHIAAGLREVRRPRVALDRDWIDVACVDDIDENAAIVVNLHRSERIAVFRYDGKVSAVSNVCAHQQGPLGEGRIVDGCITCPWHGYQYRPSDGCSPPPYTEKIPTYAVRIEGRRVLVHPTPNTPGTPVDPAVIEEPSRDRP